MNSYGLKLVKRGKDTLDFMIIVFTGLLLVELDF